MTTRRRVITLFLGGQMPVKIFEAEERYENCPFCKKMDNNWQNICQQLCNIFKKCHCCRRDISKTNTTLNFMHHHCLKNSKSHIHLMTDQEFLNELILMKQGYIRKYFTPFCDYCYRKIANTECCTCDYDTFI